MASRANAGARSRNASSSFPKTAAATYAAAKSWEEGRGFTVLNATPFYDTDVLVVSNAYAKKYGLNTISDLKKAGSFKFGAFPECKTRNTCLVGYKKQYGLTKVSFVPLSGISVYAALDAAGLGYLREQEEPIVFHDLRHTFGTQCAGRGIDLRRIQAWMGHADIQTTMRYLHYVPQPFRQAFDELCNPALWIHVVHVGIFRHLL